MLYANALQIYDLTEKYHYWEICNPIDNNQTTISWQRFEMVVSFSDINRITAA